MSSIASSSASTSAFASPPTSSFESPSHTLIEIYRDAIKDAVDEANARSDYNTLPYNYWYGEREDFRIQIAFEQVFEDRRLAHRREREAIAITPPCHFTCDDCPSCSLRTETHCPCPEWRKSFCCPRCSYCASCLPTIQKHYRKKHHPKR